MADLDALARKIWNRSTFAEVLDALTRAHAEGAREAWKIAGEGIRDVHTEWSRLGDTIDAVSARFSAALARALADSPVVDRGGALKALENVRALAALRAAHGFLAGDAEHILRFCAAAGVTGSVLRAADSPASSGQEVVVVEDPPMTPEQAAINISLVTGVTEREPVRALALHLIRLLLRNPSLRGSATPVEAFRCGCDDNPFCPHESQATPTTPEPEQGEARKPRIGVAVLVADGPRILLGRRGKEPNYGKWVIPGGGIHRGESWRDAGEREVREETQLTIAVPAQAPAVVEVIGPGEHRIILGVRGQYGGGDAIAASDLLEVGWFDRAVLPQDLSPVARELIDAIAAPTAQADTDALVHVDALLESAAEAVRIAQSKLRALSSAPAPAKGRT